MQRGYLEPNVPTLLAHQLKGLSVLQMQLQKAVLTALVYLPIFIPQVQMAVEMAGFADLLIAIFTLRKLESIALSMVVHALVILIGQNVCVFQVQPDFVMLQVVEWRLYHERDKTG